MSRFEKNLTKIPSLQIRTGCSTYVENSTHQIIKYITPYTSVIHPIEFDSFVALRRKTIEKVQIRYAEKVCALAAFSHSRTIPTQETSTSKECKSPLAPVNADAALGNILPKVID